MFAFWTHHPPSYNHHTCHLSSLGSISHFSTHSFNAFAENVQTPSLEASKSRSLEASKPRVASAGIAKRNQFLFGNLCNDIKGVGSKAPTTSQIKKSRVYASFSSFTTAFTIAVFRAAFFCLSFSSSYSFYYSSQFSFSSSSPLPSSPPILLLLLVFILLLLFLFFLC